jgi:hypothetical protein
MKANQKMTKEALMNDIVNMTRQRFIPSKALMQKCLDQLEDKEYIAQQDKFYVYIS